MSRTGDLNSAFGAHVWKKQHIAYGRCIGKQHYQTVDADTLSRRRRQTMLQGTDIIGVEMHRLLIPGFLLLDLTAETIRLVFRVIEF